MRGGQKGDWVMVMFETITRCEREKSTACGRPCGRLHQCAGVGLAQGPWPLIAAHQKSPCPAIVPLLPVMCTSVTFQPPRIGSYPECRSSIRPGPEDGLPRQVTRAG